ncbi:MAG: ImmA/IrrE family metallo-endopeptidase [Candidatus Omnitrophota bacterium]|jgi:Zn-dependent peptidase ImmA (M78 family)|nr:MAG: ImmA/IrrE family metallo-endopeptidase [Candidatus Omnitrophota bacterium]
MRKEIPITPDVLKWARERSGYKIEEISKRYKKIAEWENGKSFPTYNELEQLSNKYKCPIAVFFFPEPPELDRIEKSFRTLPNSEFERIPQDVRMRLRKARAMQISLHELYEEMNPAKKIIVHDLTLNLSKNIHHFTNHVRSYLNVSLQEQCSWNDEDMAFENWREILYDHGVFTFKDPFKGHDFSGFCLYDDQFPIIYVNNKNAKTRQIFTLFHELAHLFFKTSGIDKQKDDYLKNLENDQRGIEVFCNRFSASFLVPDDDFEKKIKGIHLSEDVIISLSNTYKVSRELISRKLLDRELIDQAYYEEKSKEWIDQANHKENGENYYYNQIIYLGRKYIDFALKKYHQNKITIDQLSEYLNTHVKNIGELEDTYFRRRV